MSVASKPVPPCASATRYPPRGGGPDTPHGRRRGLRAGVTGTGLDQAARRPGPGGFPVRCRSCTVGTRTPASESYPPSALSLELPCVPDRRFALRTLRVPALSAVSVVATITTAWASSVPVRQRGVEPCVSACFSGGRFRPTFDAPRAGSLADPVGRTVAKPSICPGKPGAAAPPGRSLTETLLDRLALRHLTGNPGGGPGVRVPRLVGSVRPRFEPAGSLAWFTARSQPSRAIGRSGSWTARRPA